MCVQSIVSVFEVSCTFCKDYYRQLLLFTEVIPVCGCRIGIDIILAAKSQYLHRRFPSFRPASRRSSILVLIGKEAFQRVAI